MYGRGYQGSGMQFGPTITPPVVKNLMIANAVTFVLQALYPSLMDFGSIRPGLVWQGGFIWQPFTYMWLHGGLGHVAMNMFVLWMFGSQLALAWGPQRFFRYYMFCGVGAGVLIATIPYFLVGAGMASPLTLAIPTVGASGAIYGVLLAYSLTWPERTIMLVLPPVAFRAIWLIPALFLMTVLFGGSNVSHVGHLGGVLMGWLYMRRRGETQRLFTLDQLKYRWRRYRMRQKLRAVQDEERETRRRDRDRKLH